MSDDDSTDPPPPASSKEPTAERSTPADVVEMAVGALRALLGTEPAEESEASTCDAPDENVPNKGRSEKDSGASMDAE